MNYMIIWNLIKNNKKNIFLLLIAISLTFYFSQLFYNFKINSLNNDYNSYKTVVENSINQQKINLLEQSKKSKEENIILNNKLKEVENENYKNYTALQKANNTIKSNIANGSSRLYINATCPATNSNSRKTENNTSSGLVNGETSRVVIDSGNAESIISITEKADKYKSQLEGLQSWVNMLLLENNK